MNFQDAQTVQICNLFKTVHNLEEKKILYFDYRLRLI